MEELPINPRGIRFQADFITASHEAELVRIFRTELAWPVAAKNGSSSKSRLSLHYGYTFDYKTFGIDPDIPYKPFPDWLVPLIPRLEGKKKKKAATSTSASPAAADESRNDDDEDEGEHEDEVEIRLPDQVCLQYYPPGAGIPPHVDTHSAYAELYALSLGSPVVMQFRRTLSRRTTHDGNGNGIQTNPEGQGQENHVDELFERETVDVDLPPRSMMEMSGESRLHWEHGIKKRKKDVLPDGTVRPRGDRWSITYRWLREGGVCECGDERLCDTAQRRLGLEREYRWKQQETKQPQEQKPEGKGVAEDTQGKQQSNVTEVDKPLDLTLDKGNDKNIILSPP
ncbi:hypothetical protein F5Y17DRAFT_440455 [Xylariaceae sp. FL0594]|nr:hypothetical protein F5Y17DRAFT_440455 [Xylariaceae sp. FL0594]